jgi:hypothetical protein
MDATSWSVREARFTKKFDAGRRYIHALFGGFELPEQIDQRAVLVFASSSNHRTVGGGRLIHIREVLEEIFTALKTKSLFSSTIPEHLSILRSFQFVTEYRVSVCRALGITPAVSNS